MRPSFAKVHQSARLPAIPAMRSSASSRGLSTVVVLTGVRLLHRSRPARRFHSSRFATGTAEKVPQVTLFTKPGCTLCDKAVAKLKETTQPFQLSTVNIDAPGNESWRERYWCDIPVFHIDGAFWAKHRLTDEEVESALAEAASGSFTRRDGEPDSRAFAAPVEASSSSPCGGHDCEGEDCNCVLLEPPWVAASAAKIIEAPEWTGAIASSPARARATPPQRLQGAMALITGGLGGLGVLATLSLEFSMKSGLPL
ncbi:Glutaredoxin-like protein C5orf63-like [Symbiodinium microadriaticum]|uniref:Glutaredoxin-like protein C5orf63-like n=1 Tax=Symbiodinium microadriaticum TaxID=2951 RepID=A0A1Q9EVG6_SYMMI|nr:Glutaredoxin-like protein C5orf63-like [Symbiodinium microadriaticum]